MDHFHEARCRWEVAELASITAEAKFCRAVRLYLVGHGPQPDAQTVQDLIRFREAAAEALKDQMLALQHCRQGISRL
jgi:hypothetical protein